jgi:radical SAM-linked protein
MALTHTKGFNPRPSVSIALPLSLGVESRCELLDFDLEGEAASREEIKERLNACLTDGVKILDIYDNGAKLKHLAYLSCDIALEYDGGVFADTADRIGRLFQFSELIVEKKGKNGITEQNIIPMIREIQVEISDANTLCIHATVCCQNPTLNPSQLVAAIEKYLPELTPDFTRISRKEIYSTDNEIFR